MQPESLQLINKLTAAYQLETGKTYKECALAVCGHLDIDCKELSTNDIAIILGMDPEHVRVSEETAIRKLRGAMLVPQSRDFIESVLEDFHCLSDLEPSIELSLDTDSSSN